jgi:hypothetical protein
MPCRIDLRRDQSSADIPSSTNDGVTIYAPAWVQEGLSILTSSLSGLRFQVHDNISLGNPSVKGNIIEEFTITEAEPLTLKKLEMIARCEPRNVTGVINYLHYEPDLSNKEVIHAVRDLVRQCVIVGRDETVKYGGYPGGGTPTQQKDPVFIADLSGLQFQQSYNTGRLVLAKDRRERGILDDLIYQRVVGEGKPSFQV